MKSTPKYAIRPKVLGVSDMDQEHLALWRLIHEFEGCMEVRRPSCNIRRLLAEIIEAARKHFDREEAAMAKCGYPLFATHRHSHRLLRRYIADVEEMLTPGATIDDTLISNLWEWVNVHIETQDQDFADFLLGIGQPR